MSGAPPRSGDRIAYALIGPTACGKSRLAMQLAARLPIEIVSLDSAQVYRGMDIGTAKPSLKDRERVPHHLADIVDPDATYSVGQFRGDALRVIDGIFARNRVPLLVGGTMLYYRALAMGLDDLPAADLAIRAALDAEAAARGWPALHAELTQVDPIAAQRIAPGDAQRIQRALEVWRVTGRPISALQKTGGAPPPFRLATFAIVPQERTALHARIAGRFDAMLEAGLIDEVRSLRQRYRLSSNLPSMRCVGYRQVWGHLEGEYDRTAMRDRAIAATRQLAKRQLTWLRSFTDVELVMEPDANRLAGRIESRMV
ncbi:MAG: tRNA (adenosine(37)-N6)-dimethylallyltransferase MiaA [Betaproteobacteria bacterium RIFCSPLOWO2_02_FULL_66_14]|nr:MAG: tRNA (adenosine(37)-N6)-dimethylallyltransferase MiaA [Betaproteobacteria bacterium RIFCSPLOWO2_02_FULL_66_14]